MSVAHHIKSIEESDCQAVMLIRGGDGKWAVHVRHPREGKPPWDVSRAGSLPRAIRDAAYAVCPEEEDEEDWRDLL